MFARPRIRPQTIRQLFAHHAIPKRTITAAPKPNSGPLMERRADRALPTLPSLTSSRRWLRTIPVFVGIMIASSLAIFNYQKQSSSVVSSTLYALRTNPEARSILGDEIYFANKLPWIRGEINQLHGRIDISFWVKGTRERAKMRFKSKREGRMGMFETLEWSIETESGNKISLLQAQGHDPFQQETADKIAVV